MQTRETPQASREKIEASKKRIAMEKKFEAKEIVTKRPNGTLRIQMDYTNCPTRTEQHTAHMTDINYLMEKYSPDELAQYIAARNQYRTEILGHDFSSELSLQDAHQVVYNSKKEFENLDPNIKREFPNHVEFLKFIDNPQNAERMLKLGILKPKQIENLTGTAPVTEKTTPPTTTKEEAKT